MQRHHGNDRIRLKATVPVALFDGEICAPGRCTNAIGGTILGSDGLRRGSRWCELKQRRRFQCEKQSESPTDSTLVDKEPAAFGREIANSGAGMQMWLAEIFLNVLDQFADACSVRLRPNTKFASEIFGEISAIKLLRSSPGIFWRVRSRFLLSLSHAGCERSFSFRPR